MTKTLDVRHERCPMTFVRVKLYLETLAPGERVEVLLRGQEALQNVTRSLKAHQYVVESSAQASDTEDCFLLTVRIPDEIGAKP